MSSFIYLDISRCINIFQGLILFKFSPFSLYSPDLLFTWSSLWIHTWYIWWYRDKITRRINWRNYIFSYIVLLDFLGSSIISAVPLSLAEFISPSCSSISRCIFKWMELFRVASFMIVFFMRSFKSSPWYLYSFWVSFASLAFFRS